MNVRRKVMWALLLFFLGTIAGAYFYFKDRRFVFTFTEEQIQAKLAERAPFRRTYLLIFGVTIDQPRVNLMEGSDRVHAGMDVTLNWRIAGETKDLGGSIDASGSLRFDPETKAFYLANPKIEALHVAGIPERFTAKAEEALTLGLAEYYSTQPIYTLRPTDTKRAAARLLLKDARVKNRALHVTLGL